MARQALFVGGPAHGRLVVSSYLLPRMHIDYPVALGVTKPSSSTRFGYAKYEYVLSWFRGPSLDNGEFYVYPLYIHDLNPKDETPGLMELIVTKGLIGELRNNPRERSK